MHFFLCHLPRQTTEKPCISSVRLIQEIIHGTFTNIPDNRKTVSEMLHTPLIHILMQFFKFIPALLYIRQKHIAVTAAAIEYICTHQSEHIRNFSRKLSHDYFNKKRFCTEHFQCVFIDYCINKILYARKICCVENKSIFTFDVIGKTVFTAVNSRCTAECTSKFCIAVNG